jgi:hypothetical protein
MNNKLIQINLVSLTQLIETIYFNGGIFNYLIKNSSSQISLNK